MIVPTAVTNYSDFFKQPPPLDHFAFLRKYPTDIIIFELSRINALIFQEVDEKLLLKKIITETFPLLDAKRKKHLSDLLLRAQYEEGTPILFTSQSLSKLIALSLSNYYYEDTNKEINAVEFQNDLWNNILVANEIYYSNVKKSDDLNTYETIWRLGLNQQSYIRRFDYIGTTAQIKVLLFHKYLKKRFENGEALIKEFIESMGLTGFFNYASITMKLITNCLSGYGKDGKAKWIVSLDESQMKMIEHFSFRRSYFIEGNNTDNVHRDIMTHPFYFVLDQYPVILDFNFLSYMMELSLTYNFYSFTSLNKSTEYKNFTAFKSMLGKSYYEEFIMDQLLKGIFCSKSCKIYDDKLKDFPDFTIVYNEKDIFFIEVKSCDIRLNTLENNDAEQFRIFLNDQFAAKSEDHGRNKGIYQLLNSIRTFATTNKSDKILSNPSKKIGCNIYPIIVYTENALDIPGVNGYLNDIFQKEVTTHKKQFRKIYPVTTINITTFIERFSLLKESPSVLKDWIKGYWDRCISNRKSFEKSKDPNRFLKAGNPFAIYLQQILEREDRLNNFKTIVEDLELEKD